MAASVLNLDTLAKEERLITLEGESYAMKEMSVEDFVNITKRAEEVEKKGEDTISKRIEFLVETVLISFPTCPKEVLVRQGLTKLNAIVDFARDGSVPAGAKEDEEKGDSKKPEQVEKSQS